MNRVSAKHASFYGDPVDTSSMPSIQKKYSGKYTEAKEGTNAQRGKQNVDFMVHMQLQGNYERMKLSKKVAGYYVIPSEPFQCPSVRFSNSSSF